MNLGLAIGLAAYVHKDQRDKAGEHYILHALAVMDMVKDQVSPKERDTVMVVAVLHDALEDFQGTQKAKLKLGHEIRERFGATVHTTLDVLTRRKDQSYEDYIKRVSENWIARVVKIADLTHNMDPRRIPADQIVDKDFQRWDKYRKALIRLERE